MSDYHPFHDHSPTHNFLGQSHMQHERATRAVVALTALMMVVEIAAGLWTGSMALLADGFHMATHAGALGVAAAAYAYARKHAANSRFAFGTGKIGDLAGFASALALALTALGIGWESVQRLIHPGAVAFDEALVVAVLGLLVNLASAWMLGHDHHHGSSAHHPHDHDHAHHDHAHHAHSAHAHDHHGQDNNLRAAYMHVLTDALTSVLAIAALLGGRWLGWTWLDPVMGIVGALVILRWAWGLLQDTALVLVDSTDAAAVAAIRQAIESDGHSVVSDVHVWRVGPEALAAILSIVSERPEPVETYRQRIAHMAALRHITIEVVACGLCMMEVRAQKA